MGISGIVAALLPSKNESLTSAKQAGFRWQAYFVAGLVLIPALINAILSTWSMPSVTISLPSNISFSIWHGLIGGFLVGVGTRLGSGCTSGHGVCGIGRLAPRSIIATCIFMLVAVFTAWITF